MAAYIASWQRPQLSEAERESVLARARSLGWGRGTGIPAGSDSGRPVHSARDGGLWQPVRELPQAGCRAVARAARVDGNGERAGPAQRHSYRLRRNSAASRRDAAVHAWFRSIDLGRRSRGHAEIPSLALQRPTALGGCWRTYRGQAGRVGRKRPCPWSMVRGRRPAEPVPTAPVCTPPQTAEACADPCRGDRPPGRSSGIRACLTVPVAGNLDPIAGASPAMPSCSRMPGARLTGQTRLATLSAPSLAGQPSGRLFSQHIVILGNSHERSG